MKAKEAMLSDKLLPPGGPSWQEIWDPASMLPGLLERHAVLPADPAAASALSGRLFVHATKGGMVFGKKPHVFSEFKNKEMRVCISSTSSEAVEEGLSRHGADVMVYCGLGSEHYEVRARALARSLIWK